MQYEEAKNLSLDQHHSFNSLEVKHFKNAAVAESHKCALCFGIPLPSIAFIHKCGKLFCKPEVDAWINEKKEWTCPTCHNSELAVKCQGNNAFAYASLICLEIGCLFESEGCKWVGQLGDLEKHLVTCEYSDHPCKFNKNGCNFKGKKDQLEEHLKSAKDQHFTLIMKENEKMEVKILECNKKLKKCSDFINDQCKIWKNGKEKLELLDDYSRILCSTNCKMPQYFSAKLIVKGSVLETLSFTLGVSVIPINYEIFENLLTPLRNTYNFCIWGIYPPSREKFHGTEYSSYGNEIAYNDIVTIKFDRSFNLSFAINDNDCGIAFNIPEGVLGLYLCSCISSQYMSIRILDVTPL